MDPTGPRPVPDPPPDTAAEPSGARPGGRLRLALVVALAAFLPSWGTLGAPLISEDAAILGYVHREGMLADWGGPQYGMHAVRFWRPLVTDSWALQESLGGASPGFLRAFNLAVHGGSAVLLALLLVRLGAARRTALLLGLAAAWFPAQGGTVTWPAGRTDLLAAGLVLATVHAVLARRPLAAAVLAFLACASKETAFVLPVWAWALAWGRGAGPGRALREAGGALVGTLFAFLWRSLAIGELVGGYPVPALEAGGLSQLPAASAAWARAAPWTLGLLGALALVGGLTGALRPRRLLAGLACAGAAALPLLPLLADGHLEATNARALALADLGLVLAAAGCLGTPRRGGAPAAVLSTLVLSFLVAVRLVRAREDVREWGAAAALAGERERDVRGRLADWEPDPAPVLEPDVPAVLGGAYVLAWGVADRFRAPFAATPRPVWPHRPLFGREESRRPELLAESDGFLLPRSPGARLDVPLLEVLAGAGPLVVDERAAEDPDRSPELEVLGRFPGAGFELLLHTELGYEPAPWLLAGEAETRTLTLRGALLASNGRVTLGEALLQAADVDATRAYLEVRAVAADGAVLAASDWIELEWVPDLAERVLR